MTAVRDVADDIIESSGRAVIYSLLAVGFALPSTTRLSMLTSKIIPASQAIDLPEPLNDLIAEVTSTLPTTVDSLRDDHMRLFPPITSSDAPGYETAYRGEGIFQQTALLADIAGFYRAHGLRSGGTEKERLDHITVELEFMAALYRKTIAALHADQSDNAQICSEMAAMFLQDHLGCWAPAYGRRVARVSSSAWYRGLGTLLTAWVEQDMSSEGVVPIELVEEPRPFEPPDDGTCGPCGIPEAEQT